MFADVLLNMQAKKSWLTFLKDRKELPPKNNIKVDTIRLNHRDSLNGAEMILVTFVYTAYVNNTQLLNEQYLSINGAMTDKTNIQIFLVMI